MLALKLLVLLAVLWGVASTLQQGLLELRHHDWQIDWRWLAVAGVIYVVGLLPQVWYWQLALSSLGGHPQWFDTLRAYYWGHLGKYVPGKALVVVLRASGLPRGNVALPTAVISIFLETLTFMAVGALLAAVFSLWTIGWDTRTVGLALLVFVVVGVPMLPPVTRFLVQLAGSPHFRRLRQEPATGEPTALELPLAGIKLPLIISGVCASGVSWLLVGGSLWAVLHSLGSADALIFDSWPLLVAAVCLSTVAGFVSLIPGGLGVRDGLLMAILAPKYGEATALLAAIVLRLVWIISEVGICGILYGVGRRKSFIAERQD